MTVLSLFQNSHEKCDKTLRLDDPDFTIKVTANTSSYVNGEYWVHRKSNVKLECQAEESNNKVMWLALRDQTWMPAKEFIEWAVNSSERYRLYRYEVLEEDRIRKAVTFIKPKQARTSVEASYERLGTKYMCLSWASDGRMSFSSPITIRFPGRSGVKPNKLQGNKLVLYIISI